MADRDDLSGRTIGEVVLCERIGEGGFGAEEADGLLWIAMELVHGVTLTRWLADHGPMPLAQLVPFFEVVLARADVLRACYQKELDRTPGIAGKVVVKFSIQPDGAVSPGLMDTATTMVTAEEVILCLKRNIGQLKFRVTTSPSEVSYPFEVSAGADGAPPSGADRSRTPPP